MCSDPETGQQVRLLLLRCQYWGGVGKRKGPLETRRGPGDQEQCAHSRASEMEHFPGVRGSPWKGPLERPGEAPVSQPGPLSPHQDLDTCSCPQSGGDMTASLVPCCVVSGGRPPSLAHRPLPRFAPTLAAAPPSSAGCLREGDSGTSAREGSLPFDGPTLWQEKKI